MSLSATTSSVDDSGMAPLPLPREEEEVEPPIEKEVTLTEALQNLLTNELLQDVQLQGSDGVLVPAQRCMLAARSKVLECLLYGSFAEATQPIVKLGGYTGKVIQALVQYLYTNNADLFQNSNHNHNFDHVSSVMSLISAANYFGLPDLVTKTTTFAISMIDGDHAFAGAFLAACGSSNEETRTTTAAAASVEDHAIMVLQADPKSLMHDGDDGDDDEILQLLSAQQIKKLVTDERFRATQFMRFLILKKWAAQQDNNDGGGGGGDNEGAANVVSAESSSSSLTEKVVSEDAGGDNEASQEEEEVSTAVCVTSSSCSRLAIAKQIVKLLRLERISPSHLSATVASSGLVGIEQLCEAYKHQALEAEMSGVPKYESLMYQEVWQSSNQVDLESQRSDYTVELLKDFQVLRSGRVHTWKIRIDAICTYLWLGVAAKGRSLDQNRFLGNQGAGWAHGNRGQLWHAGHQVGVSRLSFDVGSIVTMELDLRGEGTLRASVDYGSGSGGSGMASSTTFVELFPNLKSQLPVSSAGFVPAVSLRRPAKVHFLGFGDDGTTSA